MEDNEKYVFNARLIQFYKTEIVETNGYLNGSQKDYYRKELDDDFLITNTKNIYIFFHLKCPMKKLKKYEQNENIVENFNIYSSKITSFTIDSDFQAKKPLYLLNQSYLLLDFLAKDLYDVDISIIKKFTNKCNLHEFKNNKQEAFYCEFECLCGAKSTYRNSRTFDYD